MSAAMAVRGVLARLAPSWSFSRENRHHGLQLAAAVLLSYGLSLLLHLPEQLWAVMSTLIVLRPQTGATLDAGGERLAGTLAGVLCALAGVALQHGGVQALGVTLGVVAALAYASAMAGGLRSAPVAALIVLSGGAIAGHSPWQVAGVRLAQMAVGVAVALAISVLSARYRAGQRLHAGAAALLRRCASLLGPPAGAKPGALQAGKRAGPEGADEVGAALRRAVGRLHWLAASADREGRLLRRAPLLEGARPSARHHQQLAGLLRRTVQDVALLARVLVSLPGGAPQPLADQARATGAQALASVALVLEAVARGRAVPVPALEALYRLARAGVVSTQEPALMLAAPVRLLLADLQRLCHLLGAGDDADPGGCAGQPARATPAVPTVRG